MNSFINPYYISEFFRNLFDVPNYYIFHGTCESYDADLLLGNVGNVYILLDGNTEFKRAEIVNSIIRVTDCKEYYDLLIAIDDFIMLILNDAIKSLGGELYEKITL